MTIAAAEAALGLAIIISIFRHFGTVDLSKLRSLRG
jgi:NADH-quinone oxidoreductase subunit K